jgi:hypothetical protein
MSKFETILHSNGKRTTSTNDASFDTEVTSEKEALQASKHALHELNQNKTNQKSMAEYVASEYLMDGTKQMIEYANLYKKSFNEMVKLQTTLTDNAKLLTQKSKDYSNQVGEALARIDKVLVKDFETKLILLERFVVASKEIVELEKSGALAKVANSFFKGH